MLDRFSTIRIRNLHQSWQPFAKMNANLLPRPNWIGLLLACLLARQWSIIVPICLVLKWNSSFYLPTATFHFALKMGVVCHERTQLMSNDARLKYVEEISSSKCTRIFFNYSKMSSSTINQRFLPIPQLIPLHQCSKKRIQTKKNMPLCTFWMADFFFFRSLKLQSLGIKQALKWYQKGGDRVRQLFVAAAADRQNQKWFCVFFFARSRFRVTCAYDRSAAKEMVSSTTTTSYVDNGSFFSL